MPGIRFARRALLPLFIIVLAAAGAGPVAASEAPMPAATSPAPATAVPAATPPATAARPAGPLPAGPLPAGPVPAGPVPAGPLPAGPLPTGPVEVFRADGSRQCEEGSGLAREAMAAELTAAGVGVLGSRSGSDGLMRIAVCGAPTGVIHIFRIDAAGLATALALGFRPLTGAAP